MNCRKLLPAGIWLILVMLSVIGCQASTPTPTPTLIPTPTPTGINISGVITNLDEARPYLVEDFLLQLVPGSGQMSGDVQLHADGVYTYIENGDITYVLSRNTGRVESELATTNILSNGSFTFQIDNLAPGKYFVVAQELKLATLPMNWILSNVLALASESGNPESVIVVEIPEGISLPFIVEMGEVIIILP